MIKAMSKHAWERMQQRRGAKHYQRCLNKMMAWSKDLPDDGYFYRNRIGYVVRGGVLVTCFRTNYRQGKNERGGLKYYFVGES